MRELPERNQLAVTSNMRQELTEEQIQFVTAGPRDYETLPELLVDSNGNEIKSIEAWESRREEILEIFREEIYGHMPTEFNTKFDIVEESDIETPVKAHRRQVKITVSTDKGSSDAMMLMYMPCEEGKTFPVIIGMNFRGNRSVLSDEGIIPSFVTELFGWGGTIMPAGDSGSDSNSWCIEELLSKGFAVATILADDFAPDIADRYRNRVIDIFDMQDFKGIGAWAFGLCRGVDYLVQAPEIDSKNIIAVGHSRMGKTALWAAANDTRILHVFANDSGHAGASLARDSRGETVSALNGNFLHWMSDNYDKYSEHEDELPVDQHMLLASIAPRTLYLSNAAKDLWADPQGTWNSLMCAQKVYELYGYDVLPESENQPEIGEQLISDRIGYHLRDGWHEITAEDWGFFLDYITKRI